MLSIDLTYVGSGIHEELIAHVADQEGYFEDEGVHVALRDGAVWPTERVRAGATIGLGRALLSRLNSGIPWTVLTANTHRPLFWFLARSDVKSMNDLRGRRLAVHGARTAPGCFARIVLRKHGLDPDRDLQCVERIPADYQMDLRRLREGSIDAAYVGSTLAPEQVAAEEGLNLLAWVGDHLQIPTVGIAVDRSRIPLDDPALQALVRANKRALKTIAEQPGLAVKHIAALLNRLTMEEAQHHYERYVRPYFSGDGRVSPIAIQEGVAAVATELGLSAAAAEQMYLPAL
ncbi:ABC transporter substrate-binding protein [Paraburkholderia sp. CNPSo 3274]|uniref:ABC transporter substrate-binding protein n=1 Tax=Paraburkholderia sp. CNPSo 3274 TaxID=2940932 RepID=UPI0020B67325|nr:ABC transporter substrate-binding protein [Paraburkholderia sp. CNPSo 3274]MCP3713168.1 ABC transporter substrate-binding protein [Paraburkholderia sp. CNPSo 3274]